VSAIPALSPGAIGVNPLHTAARPRRVAGSTVPVVALWYDLNSGAPCLIKCGNALAGSGGSPQSVPSVDINTADSIGMTVDESTSTECWSMHVTERIATDPTGTMEAPVPAKAGTATSHDSRVGDPSDTSVDPSDGLTFWSANEYEGSDSRDTQIAGFKSSVYGTAPSSIGVAPPAVLTRPTQGLTATTAQDTGPGAPTSARLMSLLARRTPPAVPVQVPPPRRTIWTVPGGDSTNGVPSLRRSPPRRAGLDPKPIGRV
jgi:hypothetical protein